MRVKCEQSCGSAGGDPQRDEGAAPERVEQTAADGTLTLLESRQPREIVSTSGSAIFPSLPNHSLSLLPCSLSRCPSCLYLYSLLCSLSVSRPAPGGGGVMHDSGAEWRIDIRCFVVI